MHKKETVTIPSGFFCNLDELFIFPNLDKVSTTVDLYALQLPRTIGMLEKATDPCWGLQDYTKNTLVHFRYTICTNIAQYYLYLHSKRKMPLIHTPCHDVKSPLFHSGPVWLIFVELFALLCYFKYYLEQYKI